MKTSKRVLSFFLAVVMALTACSAGFAAFAKEVNPKDNSPFSDKYASADKSVEALDQLLDSLLPTILDAIGEEKLASIGITDLDAIKNAQNDNEDVKSAKFYEFMSQLSAFLYPKLAGASMSSVLADAGLSSGDAEKDAENYAYLNEDGAATDFWTIYSVCRDNADEHGSDLQKLCYKYLNGYTDGEGNKVMGLEELLQARNTVKDNVSNLTNGAIEEISNIAAKIGLTKSYGEASVTLNKSLSEVKAMLSAYESANGAFAMKTNDYDLSILIDTYNAIISFVDSSLSCKDLGDLLYYVIVDQYAVMAGLYNLCIVEGGGNTGFTKDYYKNWFNSFSSSLSYEDFVKDFDFSEYTGIDDQGKSGVYRQALAAEFFQNVLGADEIGNSEHYTEYILGMLSLLKYSTVSDGQTAIAGMGLTQAQVDYMNTNPKVVFPNGRSYNICQSNSYLQQFIVNDLSNLGFSKEFKDYIGSLQVTSSRMDDYAVFVNFRNAFKNGTGTLSTFQDTMPEHAKKFTKVCADAYTSKFVASTDVSTLLTQDVNDNYTNKLMSEYKFVSANYPFESGDYLELTASIIDGYVAMATDLTGLLNYLLPKLGVNFDLSSLGINLNDIVSTVVSALTQIKDENGNPLTWDTIIASLQGIYKNVATDPIGAVANILPLLTILIDEIILPIVFNGDGDAFNGVIYEMIADPDNGILKNISEDAYNKVMDLFNTYGITSLSFDLNYILPALTDYMATGSTAKATKGFYADLTTEDGQQVPIISTVGALDKLIAEKLVNCKFTASMDAGVAELLKTVISVLNDAVAEYADSHNTNDTADAKLGGTLNGEEATICKGINNIGVALPSIINNFVTKLLALYNVNSDWKFDSRISRSTGSITVGTDNDAVTTTYGTANNDTLTDVKEHIFDIGDDRDPSNVSSWLVQLIVSDWLNAIIDLFHDVTNSSNTITDNLPIISSLITSLGGFNDDSVVTDIFNSFFYLTRNSDYSFAFDNREIPCATNGEQYWGLSEDSAYYLIANVGPLVDIVMSIVNANKKADTDTDTTTNALNAVGTNATTAPIAIKYNSEKYILTKENEKVAKELLTSVDELISTILENTYVNGFSIDKVDGILSGVVTFIVNHFGKDTADEIMKVVRDYLEVICAESIKDNFAPKRNTNSNGPVDAKKVYTNKELSILVTETYSLLEDILNQVINIKGDDNDYIVNAIDGIFSPSSIAVRSNVDEHIKDYITWSELSVSKYATDLGYSFNAGDKQAFYRNLFDALGPITAIVGTLLSADTTGYYDQVLTPVFDSVANTCGLNLYTPDDNSGKELMLGVTTFVSELLNKLLAAPATTLVSALQGISAVLTDENVKQILNGVLTPITSEINGLGNVVAVLSPTLSETVKGLNDKITGAVDVSGSNIIVNLINSVQSAVKVEFDFNHFSKLSTANAFLMVYAIAVDSVLSSGLIQGLLGNNYKQILSMINKLDANKVLNIISGVLNSVSNPTEAYWTFEEYLAKETNTFTYPSGITASDADDAVDSLDSLVKNVFPLLQSLGVLDYEGLPELVNNLLFKNEMVTKIATAVYGALESTIHFSPADLASYLTDKSFGNTYSSAAAQLKKCSSWKQVKNINWGFTDGSAKAEQGFINALAALCRPVNDVLAAFLASKDINLGEAVASIVPTLNFGINGTSGDIEYSVVLKDSKLNVYIKNTADGNTLYNRIELDLTDILALIKDMKIGGSNGYESAIIPLLEAFMCDGIKTNSQYINDYNKAKDNLIINILNPLFGFVDKVLANPFDTITAVLPNVAYFIDNGGITQFLNNLLAPVTQDILGQLSKNGVNVDAIIEDIAGTDLGGILSNVINSNLKTKVNISLKLSDLNSSNIQDAIIPIVNSLLKDLGIKLPEFKWSTLASHGTQTSFNSVAGGKGIRISANQGETLVAVLRYVSDLLITNANSLKKIICSIDAVAKNKTIVNIVTTVFNQISGAHKDEIVKAVFYLLMQNPENSFFDYRNFTYKNYDFSYPSTVDVDFLTIIGPMLDGLVGGLVDGGLNQLIGGLIYKDDIISSLVCGLYGAIEKVEINKNLNLTQLLAQTNIDFTTENVAKLLTDKDYGQSYSSAANAIKKAGSWSKVNKDSLTWGVTDRDSFVHALCAALRPLYGVLDVLLNDGMLGLFDLIYLPGSDGYTSAIVPLMEAFGLYNIKTQYQYRQDMSKEYDAILLDILNPLLDKVEDILNAPIQMLCSILPNLSLFFANDGLLQLIDNLLLPITALLDSLQPIVEVNDVIKALGVDIDGMINGLGLGVKFHLDIYDLSGSLKPLIGKDNIVTLLNSVLKLIKIGGQPLGLELMPIDWFQLASHGTVITDEPSQAATFGSRIYVKADPSEVLISVLRYLINTVNYKDNFNTINNLVSGLLGGASDSISDVVSQVLGMLSGDTDEVISSLCELLQTLA